MPAPLRTLIVDDEPLARQELQYLLEKAGDVDIIAQGSNGIEAVELIRTLRPDLVFLDVRMPALDGFAVLKKVLAQDRKARLPHIVFATAFDQYAVKAFEVNAVDYLLKPFDGRRLERTLHKVRALHSDRDQPAPAAGAEAKLDALLRMVEGQSAPASTAAPEPRRTGKVVVRVQSRLLLVDQKDVCYAAIEDGRITVLTGTVEGDSNCRTLEDLMVQLDPERFWRVHRSFLVNIHHIREVVPWFKSSYLLRMDDRKQAEIPVSRSQTKRLREMFNL